MSVPGTSNSYDRGHKWLFGTEEMRNARTIKDGWDPVKELEYRQRATRCIQEMCDKLNEQNRGDKSGKMTQLCMCSASIQMHRFYYFHSFQQFKYLDVAAACLFLAGKTEESPRKLDLIVHVWWQMKFPKYKHLPPNKKIFDDSKAYIVQLENIILQTIAFDLKIELPHPIVLNLTSKSIGQVLNDHGNKRLTECAYFFATDVLCVTNWAIRYSAIEIAVCCVDIVCHFGKHEIPKRPDGNPWYWDACKTMSHHKLKEMEDEFIKIYQSLKYKLALHKFAGKGIVLPPQQHSQTDDSVLPPPPPPPPMIRNVIGVDEYKERAKTLSTPEPMDKRKSFMPPSTEVPTTVGLGHIYLPGMPPLPPAPHGHDRSRDEDERRREKDRRKEERRREERPEEREKRKEEERRRKEEERRKREHTKVMGHGEQSQPYKKPRPDMMQQFVPASSQSQFSNNGHHKIQDNRGVPPSMMKVEAPLSPPRVPHSLSNCGIPEAIAPPTSLPYSTKLSPPPRPPKGELEDGELE